MNKLFSCNKVTNSLDYLFEDSLDYLFCKDSTKRKPISISFIAKYNIDRDFTNKTQISTYIIDRQFDNKNNLSKYNIDRDFNNEIDYAFYKLGIVQPPPKRVSIKGFDD